MMKTYQNHAMTDAEARQALADACKQVETNLPLYTYQCQNHSSVNNIYPGCANNQWTCGFWPGEIWLAYEATGEEKFKTAALIQVDSFADRIARKVEVDHHDMGFLYSPTCVAAWKLVSSEKGKNAALLVTHGGHGAFSDTKISTTGNGATAAYGYSKGTYINLTDSTVDTTGNFAPAAEAAEKAMMKLAGTTASTTGYGSPAIKVSKNGGIILAENSHFTTTGQESHGVYSSGDVTLTGSTVNAQATKAAVVKNNNTLSLENSTLEGNETNSVPYNIVLYSDESAIGTMGTQQFNAKDSTLISHKGGMFYITSTHGRVTLENTTIQQDGTLPVFTVTGNDGSFGWGEAGSNGGHVQIVLVKQNLTGNILVDSISNVNMNITDGSVWTGAIHIVPNAQNGDAYHTNADIFIAAGSTWDLTEDSEVTTVSNLGTINYNGHTIKLADGTVMKA